MSKNKFNKVDSRIDFIKLEHEILDKWKKEDTFNQLRKKNEGNKRWSFISRRIS